PPGTNFEIPKDRVPEGWTVTVDPDGKVSVTPPADVTPGTKVDIPVKVTYPDGSTEETPVKVTIIPNDAQDNTPGYEDGRTKPGQ
ncbi:YPDG domain-containing protein, partial [Staphylococcus aureus]|nr:YPDG domain-containing protein [Staphylococcus aureus]